MLSGLGSGLTESWFDLIFLFQMLIFSITLHSTCNPKAAVFQTRGQRTHHSAIMSLRDGGSRFVRVALRGYKFLVHLENRGVNPSRLADSFRQETTAHPFRVKALQTPQPLGVWSNVTKGLCAIHILPRSSCLLSHISVILNRVASQTGT